MAGWLRRDLALAAPFVIVVACWRSNEPVGPAAAPARPRVVRGAAPDERASWDDASDAPDPVDAGPAAAPPLGPWPPPITSPIIARVIARRLVDGGSLLTLPVGVVEGISTDWRCQLINEAERPAATDDGCVILQATPHTTVLKTKLDYDQILAHSRAALTRP
ncbi:MAG: hypothetical protein ABIY55_29570 [Kofleriaceae bacterium]